MKRERILTGIILLITAAFILPACPGGGGGSAPVTLASITVTPANVIIITGATQQFMATGIYSDGSSKDLTSTATWNSSDETRATVSTTGLATAALNAAGSAVITATSENISGTATLKIIINLPRTGQTTSYATRDDGDLRTGVAWPDPRFTDNADGTVTDNLTGLMWLKDANCIWAQYPTFDGGAATGDGAAGDGLVTWQHALDFVSGINAGTYSNCGGGKADWRLPNRKELKSLIDKSKNSTALPAGHPFYNGLFFFYWSSTSYAGAPNLAWIVNVEHGYVISDNKTNAYYVWPVRDVAITATISLPRTGQTTSYATGDDGGLRMGVAWPNPRFTDNADGTVTDNLTGLMWLKDANCTFGGPNNFRNWADALAAASALANGQCGLTDGSTAGDWRLPNDNELESLVDSSAYNPALPVGYPFTNVQADRYWSSTTYAGNTSFVWYVHTSDSAVSWHNKTDAWFVWPVRSGQ